MVQIVEEPGTAVVERPMDNESTPLPVPPGSASRDAVSAVVVAGDAGSTIAATLTSILGQTVPPQRVVVVVAGSRDDTSSSSMATISHNSFSGKNFGSSQ